MICVEQDRDIPLPIVQLNRWVLVVGVVGGLFLQQPLLTMALFLVVLSAVLFGRRGSLIFQAGRLLLAKRNAKALGAGEVEDPRLMRFNNTLAAMLLGGAQLAFLLGLEALGWGSRWRWLPRPASPWRASASVASSITATERTVLGCLGRPRGTRREARSSLSTSRDRVNCKSFS
jgi:hypothetical protein